MVQIAQNSAPPQFLRPARDAGCIASAERELGAFISAVQNQFGPEAAQHAGLYWIEALEAYRQDGPDAARALRNITIAAASRLAKHSQLKSPARSAHSPA